MRHKVDLVLPGLFNLPLHELGDTVTRLPALNTCLQFGHRVENASIEIDSIIGESLGLALPEGLPFASGFTADGASKMIFRPVHLKPDIRNAFLLPLDENERTFSDSSILINDLLDFFKADCDISELDNGLWLIDLKHCKPPTHYPHYLSVVGRKVDQYIEQSRSALPWYQLMNEMQMFLHSHDINQQRLLDGHLSINSFWCWGAGEFLPPQCQTNIWYCDEPELKAYANRADMTQRAVADVAQFETNEGDALIVDLSLLKALKSSNDEDLPELLIRLEETLFAPLLAAVKQSKIELRLRAGHEHDLIISRLSLFKFWRQTSNLTDWLN